MGNFACEIKAHSINPVDDEVISYRLCYERFVHAEFLTHRAFARNASSSRAIPYKRMKEWINADPAMPLHMGTNRSGMQSGAECDSPHSARDLIRGLLRTSVSYCDQLVDGYQLHKEIVNRYTEPWGWINVVVSTGRAGLMNFFKLRISPYAHPNIQRLAVRMARAYRTSRPTLLRAGEWHLPFTDDLSTAPRAEQLVWSVARCAWTSYQTVEGRDATWADAQRRHDDCVALKHMTPCEHQYQARGDHFGRGVARGFDSYRSMIPGESVSEFDFGILDREYANCDWRVT